MSEADLIRIINELKPLSQSSSLSNVALWVQIIVPSVTFLLASISLIVVYQNVNRTQAKNRINDVQKFKRDLDLKTADEIIASLIKIEDVLSEILMFKFTIKAFQIEQITQVQFTEKIDHIITLISSASLELQTKYLQREIILLAYYDDFQEIYQLKKEISTEYLKMINKLTLDYFFPDETDDFDTIIENTGQLYVQIADRVGVLRRKIQNDFLGEIYEKKS